MSDITAARNSTVTTLAELIHEQGSRPWERSARLAEDLFYVLPPLEQQLLVVLAAAPARVHTKEELLRAVARHRATFSTRHLDSAAARLRADIERASGARLVCNVWGVGYRLADAAAREIQP